MTRSFLAGLILGVLLVGCTGFTYKYYGMRGMDYATGTLLGEKEADDLPFNKCQPTSTSSNPCVVIFAPTFFKLRQDYEDTKIKLAECERSKN